MPTVPRLPEPPLAGIRVVDLSRNLAGPFCTMLLADLGAEVLKVEPPGSGDDTRGWMPPAWSGFGATFLAANANKRSVAVDFDDLRGRAVVRRLAERADVVVTSLRPGSLERRGLGHEELRGANPRLVYCTISAYGSRGPKRSLPGYDPVLQAETGIMDLTGYPDGPPARLGIGAIDLGTALWASVGIQAALMTRSRSGVGGLVEVSLYETAAWWLSYHVAGFLGSGVPPVRQGSTTAFIAPYEVFDTLDGDVMVAAGNDRLFGRLCEVLGLSDLPLDSRYRTNADRVSHRSELRNLLQARFLDRSAVEWESLLGAASVPCSRVRTVADLVADDQLAALGMLEEIPSPDIPDLRLVAMPLTIDGGRGVGRLAPPRLGESTGEVMGAFGFAMEEIAELAQDGVVQLG